MNIDRQRSLAKSIVRRVGKSAVQWCGKPLGKLRHARHTATDGFEAWASSDAPVLDGAKMPAKEAAPADQATKKFHYVPSWAEPDFMGHLLEERRVGGAMYRNARSQNHPRRQLLRKTFSYRVAASHGVALPEIYGSWSAIDDIDWDGLPDRFVLKANRGTSGNAVWPLERTDHGFLAGGRIRYAADSMNQRLHESLREHHLPVFAEEYLTPGEPGLALPDDVKVYCAYGQILHVMLRRMPVHADLSKARFRYVDEHGADLGKVTPQRDVDPTVPLPDRLTEIVAIARKLSLAIPLPFLRVDLYDLPDRVVFGEMTVNPGGHQRFTSDHSRLMAEEWERARGRLEVDLANGRPYAALFGDHPTDHVPRDGMPGNQ